jgi:hypothetical protein
MALMVTSVANPAAGANPSGGQLTDQVRTLSYRGGPFIAPNPTDPLGDGSTLQCLPEVAPCDAFVLTVTLPADFLLTNGDASISVALASDNGTSDYDLYVLDEGGNYVAIGYNSGPAESAEFTARPGTHNYTIRAVTFSRGAYAYTA